MPKKTKPKNHLPPVRINIKNIHTFHIHTHKSVPIPKKKDNTDYSMTEGYH